MEISAIQNLTSIVIVTYNSHKNIETCLNSIKKHTSSLHEIIVVDNASKDNTPKILQNQKDIKIILNRENGGFGKAYNQGIREAKGAKIVFLNPEALVFSGWLESLAAHLGGITAAVGPISNFAAGDQNWNLYISEKDRQQKFDELAKEILSRKRGESLATRLLTGFCMMIDRTVLDKFGFSQEGGLAPFDESLFAEGEDLDLCLRLRREGYTLKVALDVFVYQKDQQRFQSAGKETGEKRTRASLSALRKKIDAYYGKDYNLTGEELFGAGWFAAAGEEISVPLYSIIIPVYNSVEYTKECIESIRRCSPMDETEIIIIDNGSTDNTAEYLKSEKDIKVITNKENDGFASAVNQGIRRARGDFLVILNNDVVVSDSWLDRLRRVSETDFQLGIVGPVTNYISGSQMIPDVPYDSIEKMPEYAENRWTKYGMSLKYEQNLRGFCLFVKKKVVETIGGFDERFRIGNYEDDDFCLRALRAGIKCAIAEGVFIHHHGSVTFQLLKEDYEKLLIENAQRYSQKWNLEPPAGRAVPIGKRETGSKEVVTSGTSGDGANGDNSETKIRELFEKANRFIIEQKFDEGISLYREILKEHPNHIETMHNLYAVLYHTGKIDEGFTGLEKIIELNPDYAEVYHTLGFISENNGDYSIALKLYRECIARDIDHEKAYRGYERSAEKAGITLKQDKVDFVFYTGGIKFDGNTIKKQSLGGSESALYHIAKCIAGEGYSVKVFNNCDTPGMYDGVNYNPLVDIYLFNRWNSCKVFISSRSFKPVFFDVNADAKIIWLHDMPNVAFLDQYDFETMDFSAYKFFALSKYHAEQWQEFLKIASDRFYITRNGFDPSRFAKKEILSVSRPLSRTDRLQRKPRNDRGRPSLTGRGGERNKYKLIYSSRPNRGLDVLLDIFPEIKKQIPEAELHVFSYSLSEDDRAIEPYMDKLNQNGVKFRGSVSQEVLANEIMESRVFVYPSTFKETSCISAIEAQAAGTPIVTTNLAALPETVENGVSGVVIDGDAYSLEYQKKFVREVVNLITDDEYWNSLSEGGKKRAERFFTWKNIALEWVDYFKNYLSESRDSPKLSLCMIVKNEEKTLPDCLESVKGIVDEIVIIDTGSTDATVRIAESYGAIVRHFEWIDDFAAARNESIKHATGDWILYLDADEKISGENGEKIREIVKNPDIMAVNMVEHIPQAEGNLFQTTSSDYCRLFRNDSRLKFTGRVHEQILPAINAAGGKVLKSSIRIDHWGFALSEEKRKARAHRNLKLLLLELSDNPENENDPFIHFNIGMAYDVLGNNDKAIESLRKSVEIPDESMKDAIRSTAYSKISQLYFAVDNYEKANFNADKAIEFDSGNLLAHYICVGLLFQKEQFSKAKDVLTNLLKITKSGKTNAEIDIAQVYLDIGNCDFKMNNFNDAVDSYKNAEKLRLNSFELMFNTGMCYLNVNENKKAEIYFKKAKKIQPDHPELEIISRQFAGDSETV